MTSYQRLKQKNSDLQKQYRELFTKFASYLEDPSSPESMQVAAEICHQAMLTKCFMFGSMTKLLDELGKTPHGPQDVETFTWGILDQMKPSSDK